ncbi:MAG TPA: hypothetical protein VM535_00540 [Candidatus Saccharimonadales bacterium]|nr:hypothetical protein [Candidatus Saccharimonadales bacterium]
MSRETIGIASKNPEDSFWEEEGVSFELPYGDDKYGVRLRDQEMDRLLDQGYGEAMGRLPHIGSICTIELESPDLPLFAYALSINVETEPAYSPRISMAVGIVTMSHVYEHRGVLSVRRYSHCNGGFWENGGYQIQPPLRDSEAVAAHTA